MRNAEATARDLLRGFCVAAAGALRERVRLATAAPAAKRETAVDSMACAAICRVALLDRGGPSDRLAKR